MFDSLNIPVSHELAMQIISLYSPQVAITLTIKKFCMYNPQVGPFDYELFDLAYAFELGNSPEKILFDQPKMRLHF